MYSFQTQNQAKVAAEKTLAKLKKPKGWKIVLHENLGWHCNLIKGGLKLYVRPNGASHALPKRYPYRYFTLFSHDAGVGGETFWCPRHSDFKDPNAAIEHQFHVSEAFLRKCQRALQRVKA